MTKEEIISKLKELKPIYKKDGLLLVGLFGSYARNESTNTSDIDLLYKIDKSTFFDDTDWGGIHKLKKIKKDLEKVFNRSVDLCTVDNPSRTFKQFVLQDAIYV